MEFAARKLTLKMSQIYFLLSNLFQGKHFKFLKMVYEYICVSCEHINGRRGSSFIIVLFSYIYFIIWHRKPKALLYFSHLVFFLFCNFLEKNYFGVRKLSKKAFLHDYYKIAIKVCIFTSKENFFFPLYFCFYRKLIKREKLYIG